MRLKDFTRDEQYEEWVAPDGCVVGSSKLDCARHLLNFCACGRPEDGLRYVRDGLKLLTELSPDGLSVSERSDWFKAREARRLTFFGSDPAFWFFAYWADAQDLTEHGGSVGSSWLSGKGQDLLEDLDEALAEFDASEDSSV